MAPKNLASSKRIPKQDEMRSPDYAGKEQSDEGADSGFASEAAEEAARLLVPPKKPKFTTPFKHSAPEPVESGSACSSPSASGFIIVPSQKPRRDKKKKKKKTPASKVFSDDDVISLLKGLAVFWANGRNNKWAEFHQFVKDDLPNQYTKTQVSEKIRNLKKKFDANSERARANGGRIDLSDPHESAVFELSKALWGDESGIAEKGGMGENGEQEVVENDEGSKSRKKRKQVGGHGEERKKMRKREHGTEEVLEEGGGDAANVVLEEGDVRDAANTILSIRKLVEGNGEGSKKTRKKKKKKRKQGDERDEKKEIVMEGIQVEGNGEGNKISSKRKQVDGNGERNKRARKTKLVDECVEVVKEVKQADQHKEEMLLKEGKQVDEHEQQDKTSKKQKQVDGHDIKKDLAKQGKQVDDHREEHDRPAKQTQKMEIRVNEFQYAYPLLYASFNIFGPKVAMEECVLIGRENAQELEDKWRELNAEVHRLELKKLDLMNRRGK